MHFCHIFLLFTQARSATLRVPMARALLLVVPPFIKCSASPSLGPPSLLQGLDLNAHFFCSRLGTGMRQDTFVGDCNEPVAQRALVKHATH